MDKYTKKNSKFFENIRFNINNIKERRCTICKEWKVEDIDNFYMRNKKKPEKGFNSECIECAKERTRRNIAEDVNKHRQSSLNTYYKNRDKEIVRLKKWREDNKDWKQEYQRDYWQNNPDKTKMYSERRRLHKKHNINIEEWNSCKEYFDNSCAYCGMPVEIHKEEFNQDLHKEHAYPDGSNDLGNCVPSCGSCNYRKWEYTIEEWYTPNNPRFLQERYGRIMKWISEDYKLYIKTS